MKEILFTVVLSLASLAHAQLHIVTTAPDYADIAKQIGRDKVDVHSVMKGPENVHNVMAKPTEMVYLNKADLFVHSGLDTEPWRDNLVKGARNPRILPNQPGSVDMSNGIELKEVPTGKIDRSMGDVHAYGNPHYTLNPQIAQRMAATLVKAMINADPANGDIYKKNAVEFVNSMADLSREIKKTFAPYAGLKVVTFHAAWEYFADAVDINIVGTIEPHPAITPSPQQVKNTIDQMRQQNVKVVICETYDDSKLAQYIADQTGARMVILPDHVKGVPEVNSYQELFRYDSSKLIETAKAAGVQPKAEGAAMLVEVSDAVFGYGKRPVVRVEQLHLHAGRSLGIFGPNGSGKTTLVRGISGLLAPLDGSVTHQPNLRIGYLPQYRAIDLNWPMSGLDAALLAASARRRFGWVGASKLAARDAMKRLGVEKLASSRFSTLSGGQQQRILLAGAMAASPDVLLLDEPTDGLDVLSRAKLLDLLKDFASSGLATVIISHEVEDLMVLCTEVARVHPADDPEHPGHVEVVGTPEFARQLTGVA